MNFFISDTHFGHKNIVEYGSRSENWESELISNWNSKVGKEDMVYHLGDFSFLNKQKEMFIRRTLNGNITMIRGNHDSKSNSFYSEIGISVVKGPVFFPDLYNLAHIIFSHEPVYMLDDTYPESCINVHGHTHQYDIIFKTSKISIVDPTLKGGTKNVNISLEKLDNAPISESELIERIDKWVNV